MSSGREAPLYPAANGGGAVFGLGMFARRALLMG
jgi:hypothetical protein